MESEEKIQGEQIGEVFKFFSHVSVAALKITSGSLKVGDKIRIKGSTTDIEQTVDSMQTHNKEVQEAKVGDDIGIKVKDRVRPSDKVYKL